MSNKNKKGINHGWRCKGCGEKAKAQRTSMGGLRVLTENGRKVKNLRASGNAVVKHLPQCRNYGQPNNWS